MNKEEALSAIRDFWHRTVSPLSKEDYKWVVEEVYSDLGGYMSCILDEEEEDA